MLKKKIIIFVFGIVAVVLLSLLTAFGITKLIPKKNAAKIENVLNVLWYNENDTEFTITTAEELLEFSRLSEFYTFDGQTIKLGADIVWNEGNAEDWNKKAPENSWKPITKFAGVFDGQGHTISGLYGTAHDSTYALFTDASYKCTIKNTKLVNSYFKTSGNQGTSSFLSGGGGKLIGLYSDVIFECNGENVGGIASKLNKQSTLEECWFDGVITINGRDCGGVLDEIKGARVTIKHCLFSGDIHSSYSFGGTRTGGLVGWVDATGSINISDSLVSGKINCEKTVYTGGVIGVTTAGSQNTVRDVFMATDTYTAIIGAANGTYVGKPLMMRREELKGTKAYQWTTLQFEKYWSAVEADEPVLTRFCDNGLNVFGLEKNYDISWYQQGLSSYSIQNLKQLYGFYIASGYETFEGKIVKLGMDIVVNEGNAKDWEKNAPENPWYPIANFAGTFDGQEHSVSGIYVNSEVSYQGFFDRVAATGVIENLSIKNSLFISTNETLAAIGSIAGDFRGRMANIYSDAVIISYGHQAGGLIARANDVDKSGIVEDEVIISNCWFDGELQMKGEKTRYGGGIVGRIVQGDVNISHCLNSGLLSSDTIGTGVHLGGIIGSVGGTGRITLMDSLNVGGIQSQYASCVGSVIGYAAQSSQTISIKNTYATKESYKKTVGATFNDLVYCLEESWLTGYNAYRYTELDFLNYWAIVQTGTPIPQHFASSDPSVVGIEKMMDISWYSPDEKVLTIKNLKQLYGLAMLSQSTTFKGQTIKLADDIVVNEVTVDVLAAWSNGEVVPQNPWLPIGSTGKPFAGTFDGQGHTISGVYLNTDEAYTGLFGRTSNTALIKKFKLVDSYFCNTAEEISSFGSVVGELYGDLEGVYSNAIVVAHSQQAGGLVGRINDNDSDGVQDEVTITNCWFDGSFSFKGEKLRSGGGIAGRLVQGDAVISHCLNSGIVSSETMGTGVYLGGIIGSVGGYGSLTIADTLNTGEIKVQYTSCVGSILGYADRIKQKIAITNTYATAESFTKTSGVSIDGIILRLNEEWMTGDKAYEYTVLDFPNYWAIVSSDTPILQSFAESDPSTEHLNKMVDLSWYDAEKETLTITNLKQLYGFATLSYATNFKGQIIKLDSNIKVNEVKEDTLKTWIEDGVVPEYVWLPIGSSSKPFAGTFDGQDHSISGVYLNSDEIFTGFFGKTTDTAGIQNFGLMDSYLVNTNTDTDYSIFGGVVGELQGDIHNVYSNATVVSYSSQAGGIVGRVNDPSGGSRDKVNVTSCWFDGAFYFKGEKAQYGAAVVGYVFQGNFVMEHCLNTGLVSTATTGTGLHTGGLIGAIRGTGTIQISDSLNTGKLESNGGAGFGSIIGNADKKEQTIVLKDVYTSTESLGRAIGSYTYATIKGQALQIPETYLKNQGSLYTTTLDFDNYWLVCKDDIPVLKTLASQYVPDMKVLSLNNVIMPDTKWYDANDKELEIDTEEEFYGFLKLSWQGVNFNNQTITLKNELQLNSVVTDPDTKETSVDKWKAGTEVPTNIWVPIGSVDAPFAGTFDGQKNKISGLYLNTDMNGIGLFGYVENAKIENVRLEQSYLESTSREVAQLGSIVGCGSGELLHTYSSAILQSSGREVGGLVGISTGMTINGCWYDGNITVDWKPDATASTTAVRVGGIMGLGSVASSGINNCLYSGVMNVFYMNPGPKAQNNFGANIGGICGYDGKVNLTIKNTISAGTMEFVWNLRQLEGEVYGTPKFNSAYYSTVIGSSCATKTVYSENVYSVAAGKWNVYEGETKVNNGSITGNTDIDDLKGTNGFYNTWLDFTDAWTARVDKVPAPKSLVPANEQESTSDLKRVDISWYDTKDVKTEYVLTTEEQLLGLAVLVNEGNGGAGVTFDGITISLGKDMKINEVNAQILASWKDGSAKPKVEWTPIGIYSSTAENRRPFLGVFDGKGYTISGLYMHTSDPYVGLFGYTGDTGTIIQNLRLKDSVIWNTRTSTINMGSVVGYGVGKIINVYSNAYLKTSGIGQGGLVGICENLEFISCWYDGNIDMDYVGKEDSYFYTGGLLGRGGGSQGVVFKGCLYTGIIDIRYTHNSTKANTTKKMVGGLCGYDNKKEAEFVDCISAGKIDIFWVYNAKVSQDLTGIAQVLGATNSNSTNAEGVYCDTKITITTENADKTVTKSTVDKIYNLFSNKIAVDFSTHVIGANEVYSELTFQTEGDITSTPSWYKRTNGVPVPYPFKDIVQ